MVAGISLEQETQHAAAVVDRGRRLGLHHHAGGGGGTTGGDQLATALNRDEADPAVGDVGELRIPAEGGNVDSPDPSRVENRRARLEGNFLTIQGEARHDCVTPSAAEEVSRIEPERWQAQAPGASSSLQR